jgi:hypothetical protein
LAEAERLDLALYRAVADTRTPALDVALARLSKAANYSRISIGLALTLALAGGPKGRRAAVRGMASVGVTSAVVNLVFKPLMRRRRPGLMTTGRPRVRMPKSRSFPLGPYGGSLCVRDGSEQRACLDRAPSLRPRGVGRLLPSPHRRALPARCHRGRTGRGDSGRTGRCMHGPRRSGLKSSRAEPRRVALAPVNGGYQSQGVSLPTSASSSR